MKEQKKYWELSEGEIVRFYSSLNKERETFKLSLEDLLKSEIIIKEGSNDKIAGIAGIRKHKVLPVLFIVVKSEFQGKGIGKKLIQRLHQVAKRRYSVIVLSVIKENKHAVNLFKKFGYKVFSEKKGFYYMVYTVNLKGKLLSKTLMLAFFVYKELDVRL